MNGIPAFYGYVARWGQPWHASRTLRSSHGER
jgi:hypothetical protein